MKEITIDGVDYDCTPRLKPVINIGDWIISLGGVMQQAQKNNLDTDRWKPWKPQEGELIVMEYNEDTWIVKPYSYDFTEEGYIKPLEFIQTLKDK